MHTYFLPREQVRGYLRDLASRLVATGPQLPTVWCPIGYSGKALADELLVAARKQVINIKPVNQVVLTFHRNVDRMNHTVMFDRADARDCIRGQVVLLLDSSVHSGQTMLQAYRAIETLEPKAIYTYALVIKQNSTFIPSYWGLMMDPHDRALFMLKCIPNNRLTRQTAQYHIHRLSESDFDRPTVITGIKELDNRSWRDRYEEPRAEYRSYLLEADGRVVAFVTIRLKQGLPILVEEVGAAADLPTVGHHIGILIRFAETLARHMKCEFIQVYADDPLKEGLEAVDYRYEGRGPIRPDGNQLHSMYKRVVYVI